MPKSLAEGRTRIAILTTAPADPKAPTKAELDAGIHASCNILADGYNVGFEASETVNEPAICDSTNSTTFGKDNITAEFSVFRYIDEDGKPDPTAGTGDDHGDAVFQALKEKGTFFWLYQREGADYDVPWAEGDDIEGFYLVTDRWKHTDRTGYQKRQITAGPQSGWQNITVGTATP